MLRDGGLLEIQLSFCSIRRHIESALEVTGYNKSQAARLLGIPYTTLQSKLKKLGISSPPAPPSPPMGL